MTMQFRIWVETVNGGMHKSLTEPPSGTMFKRAGGAATSSSKKSDAATEAVNQIRALLAPKLSALPPAKANSTAKIIDNQSKCYRQLGELKSRYEMKVASYLKPSS